MTFVVGLDLSLTKTGLARVLVQDGAAPAIRLAEVTSKPPKPETLATRSQRLHRITSDLLALFGRPDLAVVEGPAYLSDVGKAHDRSGLWWALVSRLCHAGVPVAEVPPSTLKVYATGKGGGAAASKDAVLAAMIHRHPTAGITGNDTADALALAAMGARALGHPIEPRQPARDCLRAMNAVHWPV